MDRGGCTGLADDMDLKARGEGLRLQLLFGEDMATEDKDIVRQVLLSYADMFALTDKEFRETSLVTQHIDTGDAKPVKKLPHRLPYVV